MTMQIEICFVINDELYQAFCSNEWGRLNYIFMIQFLVLVNWKLLELEKVEVWDLFS